MDVYFEYLEQVFGPLLNPQKRIFIGYLVSALAIALFVHIAIARATIGKAMSGIFARSIWLSRSATADYTVMIVNQAIMMGVAPRLISKLVIATILFESLHIWFDGRVTLLPQTPAWVVATLFTLTLFLLDDATKYLVHRALHRFPALWSFHKVHHSAEVLTPFTVYRTHPIEAVIFSLRSILVQALLVGAFLFFFGDRATLMTVLGANAFLFFFNLAGSNLRHSHVWISYGSFLERWLISPAQHQIHHSVEDRHHDRNFGAVLAVWDRFGGSLCLATPENRPAGYGIKGGSSAPHNLTTLYLHPFSEAAQAVLHPFLRGSKDMLKTIRQSRALRWTALGVLAALAGIMAQSTQSKAAGELNIYSHRQPFLIEPFLDAYTKKTGTKINVVYASKGLAQRLLAEGERSPADVILTVDIARLSVYADKDLLAPVHSEVLLENVPPHLRASDNRWFAFSKRARVIVVSKAAGDANTIKTYEELVDEKWRGRICLRPGSHVYNRALVASFINADGVAAAEKWARGLIANLARRPQGNDRAQVKAIFEGVCDISIINNYYYGKLKTSDKSAQRDWAAAVNLIFPNQQGRGTHINISGGGVAIHSRNKEEAVRFLEFLTSAKAQKLYGSVNFEYPVNPKVEPSPELKALGSFKEDQVPIYRISELAPEAQKVIDRVGW